MSAATEKPEYDPDQSGVYLVCSMCGTQFPTTDRNALKTCFICDDPRQYTPRAGQSFTTLDEIRGSGKYQNTFQPLLAGEKEDEATFISIVTEPKLAIGQRAILIRTPAGNVLWDCVTLLDAATEAKIRELGGLAAIVISHPHYYSTHAAWSRAFGGCPVYLASEDRRWLTLSCPQQVFLADGEDQTEFDVPLPGSTDLPGIKILKLGGHFPGSLVLLYQSRLLVADTLYTTPAGLGNWDVDALGAAREGGRPPGLNSYSFMWSIPNMIPLAPGEIARMWSVLKKHEFISSHGAFVGMDIVGKDTAEMRKRILDSMRIQMSYMGYGDHTFLAED
jgi:glyoxylase-like metal-dependent hydrolase (beta-lactamase superfamily II)